MLNTAVGDSKSQSRKRSCPHATINVPSLYPVYLPYQTQHQLLVKVQGILEKACYEFGARELKETVQNEGWGCAESAELNRWPQIFLLNQDKFLPTDLQELGKPFAQVLNSITQIRHTAVHRLRISANRLEQFMIDAEAIARLLRNDNDVQRLTRLRVNTQVTIDELKRNKDLLESKLSSKLRKIASQRAELDRLEHVAIVEMLKEDNEYKLLAGANLEEAIRSPDAVVQSNPPTGMEPMSEEDPDEDFDAENVPATSGDQYTELAKESWVKTD